MKKQGIVEHDEDKNVKVEIPKDQQCNGCKFLNFAKVGCYKGLKRKDPLRPLNTYTNKTGYITVIKPPDCDYDKSQSKPVKAS